jgi:glyoxylase-like metal-dependent hydrolase (beta-lactamase superfamily II)
MERLKVRTDLRSYLARQQQSVQGVFLTHLHLDHVSGLPDLPNDVPIHVGSGDAEATQFVNIFGRSSIDAELEGKRPLQEIAIHGELAKGGGVLDVFGDGQLWALSVPGHTKGSLAYVARTSEGPVLITGDASHTAWGWNNGVEPGSFSADKPASATSLGQLRALAARHPKMSVRLGHQALR